MKAVKNGGRQNEANILFVILLNDTWKKGKAALLAAGGRGKGDEGGCSANYVLLWLKRGRKKKRGRGKTAKDPYLAGREGERQRSGHCCTSHF